MERRGRRNTGIQPRPAAKRSWLAIVWLLIMAAIGGCGTLRLPAIDPSGQRIFLPHGNSTNLTLPRLHANDASTGVIPQANFREPPPPPACLEGPSIATTTPTAKTKLCGLHSHSQPDRGRCGQLLLTPTRIVAPVNGDVVLLAGVCGEDGYLVTGESIEWMISPESVGQIVEVGGQAVDRGLLHRQVKEVRKLDVDFARGVTVSDDQFITRGSQRAGDDLRVARGQTWLSLTSPSEGVTRVTALAPDAEVWDRRRQTATIYWVDARWEFPAPVSIAGTSPAVLTTRVTRAEGFAPAEGWIVRYRSLDPATARFGPGDTEIYEARVDGEGKASATLSNVLGRSAVALVSIEVIRPAQASEYLPELTLGRGQTTVQWSTIELDLQANGPASGSVGQTLQYNARLSNFGDIAANNTIVTMAIPAGMQLVDATPAPSRSSPTVLAWDQGLLQGQQALDLSARLTPTADGDYRIQWEAAASEITLPPQTVSTLVTSPRLSMTIAPAAGYEQVEVGSPIVLEINVRNDGSTTLANLSVEVNSDEGLQHVPDYAKTIAAPISRIEPGQTIKLNPNYVARTTGTLAARANVSQGGAVLASGNTSIVAVAAAARNPAVQVQLVSDQAENRLPAAGQFTLAATATNVGDVPLQSVTVLISYPAQAEPVTADPGFQIDRDRRLISWSLPPLAVGGNEFRRAAFTTTAIAPITFSATAASTAAVRSDAVLTMSPATSASGDAVLPPNSNQVLPPNSNQVLPPNSNQVLPPSGSSSSPAPAIVVPGGATDLSGGQTPPVGQSSQLSLSLEPVRSESPVNAPARYVLTLANTGTAPDQDVQLRFLWSAASELVSLTSADGRQYNYGFGAAGNSLELEPIRYLAPGERLQFIVTLRHTIAGNINLTGELSSRLDPTGVRATGSVEVRNQ